MDSRLENVTLAGPAVSAICRSLGMDENASNAVELCVVEAVTNVIKHSYGGLPGHEASVVIEAQPDRLTIKVSSTGAGIPRGKLEKPRLDFNPKDIARLPQGGMGIYLIHKIMNEVKYDEAEGINTLTMVKNLGEGENGKLP